MQRNIITIDEDKCTGCGLCIPNCPEGAIQLLDGKARLVSDLFCDGLGACLGHCPEGAITIEKREADSYDEKKVMENVIRQGPTVIKAHLEHLRDHGQHEYLQQAVTVLAEKGLPNPLDAAAEGHTAPHAGCPGSRSMNFAGATPSGPVSGEGQRPSKLAHWPIQLHLISPGAPQYQGADVLLAADCTAYALGDFHKDHLAGKALAIACPKLDDGQEVYTEKIKSLIDDAKINTLTVTIMEVPCCMGLLQLTRQAVSQAKRTVPIKLIVVGVQGKVIRDEWVMD